MIRLSDLQLELIVNAAKARELAANREQEAIALVFAFHGKELPITPVKIQGNILTYECKETTPPQVSSIPSSIQDNGCECKGNCQCKLPS